ncbi:hypothetical protein [Cetobacterium somerae]|uniref:hypothetical protein n=1 Tax=Cetobacterium somerae TaxID=188913 RepID=UPI00248E29F7|nr:hypothetical protein [Cetobacterium somerae]
MVQINTTNINIFTLFSQGNFSLEELSLYLNLEKKSIYKNINSINSFLKDENLPLITLNEGIYSLKLSKFQWENLFRRKDFITSDEIVDYLYLKFIHNGFINLESEKERLNISRSSIIRYFNDIKKTLEINESQYEYIVGRGLKLTFLSQTDKNIFSKKLIKFFIKCDFSLNHSIFIIDLIKDYDINKLLNHLYRIFKALNLPTTHFIISFLCSLNICIKVFGGFNFKKDYEYKDFSDIENIIKSNLKDYDALYQQQIFYFIISLKRDEINFEPSTLEKAFKTIEEVKEKFNLNNLNPFLEKMLLKKICFSIFKYENHIFKVKSSTITNKEKTLLNILDNILKKYNLNLFFCDKISIIQIIVKIIIEHNKDSLKNILLLFNEVIILDDNHLKDSLYNHNKKFNFHIEPTFFYKLNPENYENKYDLILSDEPSLNSKTIVVNSFNSMQVLSAIYGYIFDKALENFSYK